jgi:SAM-dependent methyltransferase
LAVGPNQEQARRKYRRRAHGYDFVTAPLRWYREQAISLLELKPGATVLDLACGTGINFTSILRRIGPTGSLIGVDLSAEMLEVADQRSKKENWSNVTLVEASVERADLPAECDAALFSLTHDVLQSRPAIANVVSHLRPGSRVASFGAKWAGGWRIPINAAVWLIARNFVTTLDGFDRPWQLLDEYVELEVRSVALGGAYIASGQPKSDALARP